MRTRYMSSKSTHSVEEDQLIGAIDIGASKVTAFIASHLSEAMDGQDIEIIGVGHQANPSVGIDGLAELETSEAVRSAVSKAQNMASQKLDKWVLSVSGRHTTCKGIAVDLILGSRFVMEEDLFDCYKEAVKIAAIADEKLLHLWPTSYTLDEHSGIRNPIGMSGKCLSITFTAICTPCSIVQNLHHSLSRCQLELDSLVAAPYAAARGVLLNDERELGVLSLDIGAYTTSFSLYQDGNVLIMGGIPTGGALITQEIAKGFNVSLDVAERAKRVFGTAFCAPGDENRFLELQKDGAGQDISITQLANVIGPHVQNLLDDVLLKCRESGYESDQLSRIVLSGGGGQLQGVAHLIHKLTGINTRLGKPRHFFSAPEAATGAAFSVCAGMVRHAADKLRYDATTVDLAQGGDAYTKNESFTFNTVGHTPVKRIANWILERF